MDGGAPVRHRVEIELRGGELRRVAWDLGVPVDRLSREDVRRWLVALVNEELALIRLEMREAGAAAPAGAAA